MAITQADLSGAIGISADASSYGSAEGVPSITPTANRLVLAFVGSTLAASLPASPTITGNGLTWVVVQAIGGNTIGSPRSRLTLFRAMGASPSTGAPTISFAGVTQQCCVLSIFELAGVDTSGTDGSGAIIQTVDDSLDAVQVVPLTMAAFASSTNGAVYGVLKDTSSNADPESGWTEIHEPLSTTPTLRLHTYWRATADATIAGASWAPSAAADAMAIAAEISEPITAAGGWTALDNPVVRVRIRGWS
jgi:hypothetical protein